MKRDIRTRELISTLAPMDNVINRWLMDYEDRIQDIIDIKYSVTVDETGHLVRHALIIYEGA